MGFRSLYIAGWNRNKVQEHGLSLALYCIYGNTLYRACKEPKTQPLFMGE